MKKLSAPHILCALGIFLLTCGAASAQQEETAARSVPADTILYVSADVPSMVQFWKQVQNSSLGKLLAGGKAKSGGAGSQKDDLGEAMALLGQAFQGRVSFALRDEELAPGKMLPVVAVLPVRARDEAQAMIMVLKMRMKQEQAQAKEQEYQGVKITTLSGPKLKRPLSYALLDEQLLVGNDEPWLEKALDAYAGRAQGLAANPNFTQVSARITAQGAGDAWFWLDPQRYNARVLAGLSTVRKTEPAKDAAPGNEAAKKPETPPVDMAALQNALKPLMDVYTGMGGRIKLAPDGVSVDGLALVNQGSAFGQKLLAQRGGALQTATLAPRDPVFYAGVNNLPLAMEMMRVFFGALKGEAVDSLGTMKKSVEEALGLKLQEDLGNYVGSEAAVVLTNVPTDVKSLQLAIYVQTNNKPALGKSMQRLRARLADTMGIPFVQKELPQGRLYYIDPENSPLPLNPGWTFAKDFLVLGASADVLKSTLSLAGGAGASLATAPAYQAATAASGDRLLSVFYLNMEKLGPLVDKMAAKKKDKDDGSAQKAATLKQAFQLLHSVTASSSLEADAISFHMKLAADLTK